MQKRPKEFIVSADGDRKLFSTAKRLVAAAPALPGWRFIALRPPKPVGNLRLPSGRVLRLKDIWFIATPNGSGFDVNLAINGFEPSTHEAFASGSFLMLDALLGEEVVETRIRGMRWMPLPTNPKPLGLRPISELPELLGVPRA